jgi:hypothetical protein
MKRRIETRENQRATGGLAQAGQCLARKFVQIWKFCARPNVSETATAPSRWLCASGGQRSAIRKRKDRALQTTIAKFESDE